MPELSQGLPVLIGGIMLGVWLWEQLNQPAPVPIRAKKPKRDTQR